MVLPHGLLPPKKAQNQTRQVSMFFPGRCSVAQKVLTENSHNIGTETHTARLKLSGITEITVTTANY